MDLAIAFLSLVVSVGQYLLGISLYWHFLRIGRIWIARILWLLLAAYTLVSQSIIALEANADPSIASLLLSLVPFALIVAVLSAPFWNPLPAKAYSFDPDEPDDGKPFKVPDKV